MYILFEDPEDVNYDLLDMWNTLESKGYNPYIMTHHELAAASKFTTEDWKEFLTNDLVVAEIKKDLLAVQKVQFNKLVYNLDDNQRSTGTPAIMAQLMKNINETDDKRDSGPRYIYCHVPLNNEEKNAPNVIELEENPFIVD